MDEGVLLVRRIEMWAWGMTVVLSALGYLLGGAAVGGGVAAGSVVAILNFKWLHFFFRIAFAADRRWAKAFTHLGLASRYMALTAVVYLLIKTHWVNLLAVLAGLSVLTMAVVVVGLLHGMQSSRTADQTG